ncbi:MAG: hypothetical protein K1000chlam4_00052 [Chlamydiae bacterium]|nr:hypothetical protein [Chlamydiota bacterium]
MRILLFAIISFLTFSLFGGVVNQNNDFQVWILESVNTPLSDKFKLHLDGELRYGDDGSTLYLWYIQTRLDYSACNWLDITPGYRHLYVLRPSDRKWLLIYDPLLDITLKSKLGRWQIADRNRTQYLLFDSGPTLWQYRNRILAISPWKLGGLNPQISNEFFFRENVGYAENRFSVGGTFQTTKKTSCTLLYTLRHQKRSDMWKRHHVLWAILSQSF